MWTPWTQALAQHEQATAMQQLLALEAQQRGLRQPGRESAEVRAGRWAVWAQGHWVVGMVPTMGEPPATWWPK